MQFIIAVRSKQAERDKMRRDPGYPPGIAFNLAQNQENPCHEKGPALSFPIIAVTFFTDP